MHNPVEAKGFFLKVAISALIQIFMNVMQKPGPDLPYGTVPGA